MTRKLVVASSPARLLWLLALLLVASHFALPAAAAQSRPAAQPADSSADLFQFLDFRIEERGGLRFAGRSRNVLALREPRADSTGPESASLDVTTVFNQEGRSPESAVRARIERLEGVSAMSVRAGRSLAVDGVQGYEMVADAADAGTGERLLLYRAALPNLGFHVFFEGRVGADRGEHFLPRFRAVVESFHRTSVARATLRGIPFEVVSRYLRVPEQSSDVVSVFHDAKADGGLFVAVLDPGARREAVLKDVLRRVGGAASPAGRSPFRWSMTPRPSTSTSEVHQEHGHGFDGNTLVVARVRHLRRQGRDVLTGYYFVAAQGAQAAALSRGNVERYTEDLGASGASDELIRSLVGVKPGDSVPPVFTGRGTSHER